MLEPPSRPPRWLAAAVLVYALLMAAFGNGAARPLEAHEAFVARSATEMLRRDDWILPYFNGEPRLQKPPLNYWGAIAAHELVGAPQAETVSENQARAPSALGGVLMVLLTMLLARTLGFRPLAAALSGALLASSTAFLDWSHNAQPEMLYAALCTLELLGFAQAWVAAREGRSTLPGCLLAWTGAGLAVLAKGPLLPGFLLAGATLASWLARDARPRPRRNLRPLLGLTLVLAFVLPWVALVVHREPQAPEFWRSQMFDRTGGVHSAWWQPLKFFYVTALAKLAAPWSLLAFAGLIWGWRTRSNERLHARWLAWVFVVPLVVLGFSARPKGYYLLPALAPLFVLMAETACVAFDTLREQSPRWVRNVLRVHAGVAFAAAAALFLYLLLRPSAFGARPLTDGLGALLAIVAAGAAVDALRHTSSQPRRTAIGAGLALAALMLGASVAAVDPRSARYEDALMAQQVGERAPHDLPLYLLSGNAQVLTYYADRCVEQVTPEQLAEHLATVPDAFVLATPDEIRSTGLDGEVVLEGKSDDDTFVLLDIEPRRER
ncbi:MAG: phospholipid carrier-dependent glycosyltransferase [Planctomycetota bacterium]|nr:phospholipid carrier-dependent glycosyltransferase [Planctomycetota bacterium]